MWAGQLTSKSFASKNGEMTLQHSIILTNELLPVTVQFFTTFRTNKKSIEKKQDTAKEEALKHPIGESDCKPPPHPIDVVYTWVNGSDPNFQSVFSQTDLGLKTHKDDVKAQRFEGNIGF